MSNKRKDEVVEQGQVTVTAGREVYAPVAFHSFEVGPLSVTTDLQSGETFEQAYGRANAFLEDAFTRQFESKMEAFFTRLGRVDEYMIGKGMVPRAQAETFRATSCKPAAQPAEPEGEANEAGWVGEGAAQGNDLAATENQLRCMEKIAAKISVNVYEECERVFGCSPEQLKKPAMSRFLDYINDEARFPKMTDIQRAQVSAGTLKRPAAPANGVDDDIPF